MDDGGKDSYPNDEGQKELSISRAASSMINASNIISPEVYQANLKRIQEVKEMVHRLELNNEAAHKNYVVEQLEKRAQEGREAEDVLARLRGQPRLHEAVPFTSNIPGDRPEVILPTTASVVEVPDSRFSPPYSSPVTTRSSQTIQQTHPGPSSYQQIPAPPQIQQHQNNIRYYTPPQHNVARHSQANVDVRQMPYYSTQNVPPQAGVYNPSMHPYQTGYRQSHVQLPLQSQSGYPLQGTAPLGTTIASAQGLHAQAAGQSRPTPTHGVPSEPPTFRPIPTTVSKSTYSKLQPPFQQPQQHPQQPPHQSQQLPQTSTQPQHAQQSQVRPSPQQPQQPSRFQQLPQASAQPQHAQQFQAQSSSQLPPRQSQQFPQTSAQPQHVQQAQAQPLSQQPPRQSQQLPQASAHPQHGQQSQVQFSSQQLRPPRQSQQPQTSARSQHAQQFHGQPSSHQPLQPPQAHSQGPLQSADRVSCTLASQSPNQPTQPIVAQEQTQQQSEYSRADQVGFVKLFHNAVYRGPSHLKAFWLQAHVYGISEEWFRAAISSLPGGVWESIKTQIRQQESATSAVTPTNAPQQQSPPNSDSNGPVASMPSTPAVVSLVETTPTAQQATKVSTSIDERISNSIPAHIPGSYAAPLQYYAEAAEQATKSSLVFRTSISTLPPGNLTPTLTAAVTPRRDAPQGFTAVRTPTDANKSTLAQDILRSLGRSLPKSREAGTSFTDKTSKYEDDQRREEAPLQLASPAISSTAPNDPTTGIDVGNLPSTSSVHGEPPVAPPSLSNGRSVLPEELGRGAVTKEPIMIDLTLEDSENSVDTGQGQESTFLTSAGTTASQPVHSTNAANDSLLMETLSLEESSVDATADGGNYVDVRMSNPPLSPAPETNVESDHLLPRANSAQPVSPGIELSLQETLHPQDDQLPLFLPSPPTSPGPTEPPETDIEMIYDEGERLSLKRRSVSVDEVEIGGKLKRRPRNQVYVLIPSPPLYVRKAMKKRRVVGEGLDSGLEGVGDEESQYNHLEQILIEESKSRLLERRCRWLNCASVLNCAANLLSHLKNHVREDSQAPFCCRWATCQRRFLTEQECNIHLEKHTTRPLPCPFAGCDEMFDKPVEVMQHEVQHQRAEPGEPLIRKPTCEPIVPVIPAQLGPPTRQLPSHRVIPRRVFKCRISADRHAILGPWILWNIFSPVEPDMRKQNASMRSGRPVRQAISYDIDSTGTDARRDDYDFLLALTSYPAKSRQLDDLDSALVTMSAARGLTLWGSDSESHVNLTAESATPEETRNAVSVAVAVDATTVTRGNSMSEGLRFGPPSGVGEEEDVVEQMLV